MKKSLVLLLLGPTLVLSQTKSWQLTTASEFSQGTADNTIITSLAGGEVRLPNPLIHQGMDSLDTSTPKYVSYDDFGNSAAAWVSSGRLNVQKFDVNKRPLTPVILADDSGGLDQWSQLSIALLNSGHFAVGWKIPQSQPGTDIRCIQFFDAAGNRIGANQRVFSTWNGTGSIPQTVADRAGDRYILLSPERITQNSYHIQALLYSSSGARLRDSIDLNGSNAMRVEINPKGAVRNGRLIVAWEGSNVSFGPGNIYAALYDTNCVPTTTPVQLALGCTSPSVAFDDNGNACITWYWSSFVLPANPPDQIYAQVLDPSMQKVGGPIELSNLSAGSVVQPTITFVNGMFRLTYQTTLSNGQPPLQWVSYWKLEGILSGTYTSPVFDAGNPATQFLQLSWTPSTFAHTLIQFRLRSSSTIEGIQSAPWLGPTSDSDYYTIATGEPVNTRLNNGRYLQARAFLQTQTVGTSPILYDFTVIYQSSDSTAPAPPPYLTATSEHRRVVLTWPPSPSPDVMNYAIFRTTGNASSSRTLLARVNSGTLSYSDSAVVYDSTYLYEVAGVDSSWNMSSTVQAGPVSPAPMRVFVSTSGSPQGDGTADHPFSLPSDAVQFAGKGDTVFVLPGEYAGNITLKNNLALIGSGATTTKLISSAADNALTTGSNNVIKGLTIVAGQGIVCRGDNVLIAENILTHEGGRFDLAVSAALHSNITVAKNFILNFSLGIQSVAAIPPPTVQTVIRNNIIRCATGVQNVRSSVSCVNNTFILEGGYGYGVSTDGDAIVLNNCFAGYASAGSYLLSVSSSASGTHLVQYNNRWGCNGDKPGDVDATNMMVDPEFVDATKNDFHLQPASQCRNAGSPAAHYNDADGSRNDIGAYGGPDPLPDFLTFASPTDVVLNSVSGFPGDTVAVGISLSNAAGLEHGTIGIEFDNTIMTFLGAAPTSLTAGFSVQTHTPSPGTVVVILASAAHIASGSGSVAELRFLLNGDLSAGRQAPLEVGNLSLFDGTGNPIAVASISNASCVVRMKSDQTDNVFVDGSYTGTSDGTMFHPWTTVQQGIDNSQPGDTVVVAAGTYVETVVIRHRAYLRGLGANVTTIECPDDPSLGTPTGITFEYVDSSGIEGCSLVNRSVGGLGILVAGSDVHLLNNRIDNAGGSTSGLLASSGSHITIRNNYFVGSGSLRVIDIVDSKAVITGNVFSPTSVFSIVGIDANADAILRNNRFYLSGEGSTGIVVNGSGKVMIANNLFSGDTAGSFGVQMYSTDSVLVANNVFDGRRDGLDDYTGAQQVYNNIFVGNDVATNLLPPTEHRYNLFWNNKLNFSTGEEDPSELTADPLFVDQAHGNYRLLANSPAIDAGYPGTSWSDPDGTRNDIGIFGGPYADTTMFFANSSRVRIGNVPGSAGDTVIVPISASGISGISGFKLLLTFNGDRVTLLEAHTTPLTADFVLNRNNIGSSFVELTLQGSRALVTDSGAVMTLAFLVGNNTTGTVPLKFQTVQLYGANTQTANGVTIENGNIVLGADVVAPEPNIPMKFALYQNYPNPFNPSTTIRYDVPARTDVRLEVFDILGRQVMIRRLGTQPAGTHEIVLNLSTLSSGVYFYQLRAGKFVQTKKMVVMK